MEGGRERRRWGWGERETKEENNGVKEAEYISPSEMESFRLDFQIAPRPPHGLKLAFCCRRRRRAQRSARYGEAAAHSGALVPPALSFIMGLMSCSVKYPEPHCNRQARGAGNPPPPSTVKGALNSQRTEVYVPLEGNALVSLVQSGQLPVSVKSEVIS